MICEYLLFMFMRATRTQTRCQGRGQTVFSVFSVVSVDGVNVTGWSLDRLRGEAHSDRVHASVRRLASRCGEGVMTKQSLDIHTAARSVWCSVFS